jgi:predicted transcriptional regulator
MDSKSERDYTIRHEKVVNKLMEIAAEKDCGCVSISKLATELGMDQRTVRAHLKIIEIDHAGVFTDSDERQFCTREGIILLAKRLGLGEVAGS